MNVLEMFSLKGKTALVTGGAGLYGRQVVEAVAEAGAKTYIAARNLDKLEEVAEYHRSLGQDVTALQYDQGEEDSINALRDEIEKRSGPLDVLVNNSAARPVKDGWETSPDMWDLSLHVNGTGLFLITRAFAEGMKKRETGSIINIGSMMGMVGIEMANYIGTDMGKSSAGDYFFHKGGVINFTRFCASILGPYNVRVNTIAPGGLLNESHPEAFIKNYSERTQLGRLANQTDLKGAVLFLASDASQYVTGVNLPVDGGYTAK